MNRPRPDGTPKLGSCRSKPKFVRHGRESSVFLKSVERQSKCETPDEKSVKDFRDTFGPRQAYYATETMSRTGAGQFSYNSNLVDVRQELMRRYYGVYSNIHCGNVVYQRSSSSSVTSCG